MHLVLLREAEAVVEVAARLLQQEVAAEEVAEGERHRPQEGEVVGVEEEVPRLLEGAAAVGEEAVHH